MSPRLNLHYYIISQPFFLVSCIRNIWSTKQEYENLTGWKSENFILHFFRKVSIYPLGQRSNCADNEQISYIPNILNFQNFRRF